MIGAVFDCVVFVQAAISDKGPAAACLSLVEDGQVKLFVSAAVLEEVRETLFQQNLRIKFPHLTDERVEQFLQRVARIVDLIHDSPSVFSLPRDPDDAIYVDLALTTHVPFIVSRDKDLLDLMKDDGFRKAHSELTIIEPAEFLSRVRTEVARELGYE